MIELVRLPDAAKELGISYPTLKQWIYRKRLQSVKTAGGHHRIPRSEINRLMFQEEQHRRRAPAHGAGSPGKPGLAGSGLEYLISGRNQLMGVITSVKTAGLLAKVTLDIGGQNVTAIITRESCRQLGLKRGATAAALIKATEVMIVRPA